ncbi:glycosyltransferase [Chloroflexi bacterium TSY]|nr:glycosyltransferase [Chloroflexi bacterium TSY]
MKINVYRLYDHATAMQPSPDGRDLDEENKTSVEGPPLDTINSHRWDFLCPYAIEATWNGGPDAADIEIRTEDIPAGTPSCVQSSLGGGRLTFHTGYQIKTEAEQTIWIRVPINQPKDGLYPLESVVDTSILPCTMTINWTFTRPNQTVRFAAGEPFCTILPYPKGYAQNVEAEIVTLGDDLAALDEEYQTLTQDPAIHNIFQKLGANGSQANSALSVVAVNGSQPEHQPHVTWATQLNAPPPVSCICPTYGRVALLEEAIYSFLRQDYPGEKELIVLNDFAEQTLEFDHPEVRIVNLPKRFHSVGEKYKAAAALATHDLVFVWHDDDIYPIVSLTQ